ncbi:YdcF family protein [Acidobacteria bacterium AH-259-L09]|nr:YdcF family protein [Acidobacteria bacterium AH-259-L09]
MRKLSLSLVLVLALIVCAFSYAPSLANVAASYLVTEEKPQKVDVIVVLAGQWPERVLEALDLYRAGYAPHILLTRPWRRQAFRYVEGQLGFDLPSEEEVNRDLLMKLGVPSEAIWMVKEEVTGTGTRGEAEQVRDYLLSSRSRTALLVTSRFHTNRAKRVFATMLPGHFHLIVIGSRYDTFNPVGWWKRGNDRLSVVLEYLKLTSFYLGLYQ